MINIFDMMGPVMVGPSSSHTAGAARIGNMGRTLLGEEVARADIGMKPDDLRIPNAYEEANRAGMAYSFRTVELRDAHPNTALLELTGKSGKQLTLQASSIGGGAIVVNKIDGIDVNFTGDFNTLIVRNQDESGSVAAITSILSQVHINVANMSVNRHRRGGDALMVIETDQHIKPRQVEFLSELPGILSVTYYDKEDDEDGAGFDEGNL